MIRGVVNAKLEAIVRLRVRGPGGVEIDVDTLIDSGFSGSLTLPATMVTALGLARQHASTAVLADGSVRQFDMCPANVAWNGTWRPITVSALGNEILMGTRLLAGHKLDMDMVPGGAVEISPLP